MKTTVDIEDALLRLAKKAAVERGSSLREVIEAALRRELLPRRPKPLKLVTVAGGAPAGIASRRRMWAWLDRHPESR